MPIPEFKSCHKAAETWDISRLFQDLQAKHWVLNDKPMGAYAIQYLCLLLSGKEPAQMTDELLDPVETIRVKISQSLLYKTIERLTGGEIKNWRDPIILFVNKGYRITAKEIKKVDTLLVMTCDVEVSETVLRQLEEEVQKILGANKLRIQKLERGSLIIFWEGSQVDCNRIKSLFEEGELSERLRVPVLDVQVVPTPVYLSQWFDNLFTRGWQTVEELLTPQQLRPAHFSESVQRAKRIDLQINLITHQVNLVVSVIREDVDNIIVNLKVFPTADSPHLPANLKLVLLVDEEILTEITSRSADQYMQQELAAQAGEAFTVKLVLDDQEVTEYFVV